MNWIIIINDCSMFLDSDSYKNYIETNMMLSRLNKQSTEEESIHIVSNVILLLQEQTDEDWNIGNIIHTLTNR